MLNGTSLEIDLHTSAYADAEENAEYGKVYEGIIRAQRTCVNDQGTAFYVDRGNIPVGVVRHMTVAKIMSINSFPSKDINEFVNSIERESTYRSLFCPTHRPDNLSKNNEVRE